MSGALERFPELAGGRVVRLDGGWDFDVFEVDAEWIVRIPNRREVEVWLAVEARVLRELAPTLPVRVPQFEVSAERGPGVAYRKIAGTSLGAPQATSAVARQLGEFLTALHAFDVERALALGVTLLAGERLRDHYRDHRWRDFRERVLPLLERPERSVAEERAAQYLDDDANFGFAPALVHRDLGPEHILCADGGVSGVIDWSDLAVADPALDFSWLLHGLGDAFARDVLAAYRHDLDATFLDRARFYHLLGPFYEVTYGLDTDRPDLVASGLAGVRRRLQ